MRGKITGTGRRQSFVDKLYREQFKGDVYSLHMHAYKHQARAKTLRAHHCSKRLSSQPPSVHRSDKPMPLLVAVHMRQRYNMVCRRGVRLASTHRGTAERAGAERSGATRAPSSIPSRRCRACTLRLLRQRRFRVPPMGAHGCGEYRHVCCCEHTPLFAQHQRCGTGGHHADHDIAPS